MEYRLNHTLEHKSKFQKALSLWQEFSVIDKILSYYRNGTFHDIPAKVKFEEELLNEVIDSVTDFSLPHLLKADLFETIGSVGQQILKYVDMLVDEFYESPEKIDPICIEDIFWTEDGVINKPKSLKYLIGNTKPISLENAYRLSCKYCMDENVIDSIWWLLPAKIRRSNFYQSEIYENPSLLAIAYWKHYREETLSELIEVLSSLLRGVENMFDSNETVEENLFRYSAAYATNEATIFFYNKIAENRQQQSLVRCMKILLDGMLPDGEIILFILSHMNEENRRYIIHQFPNAILKQLLDCWPWREFYISIFNNIAYLTKDMFLTIINDIVASIKWARKSCTLKIQLILSKIWNNNISKPYKKYLNFFEVFMLLLEAGDIENVVLISTDKESENVSLTHLAFLIIHVKYVHLLEKFEDSVNEKMKPENIDEESLKYCLSEFLINQEYEAVTKILSWYFGNRQEELETFISNFPSNTTLKKVWKTESAISPTEHSEKVLECIFGKDKKKIEIAKSNFSEEECLFDVFSILLKGDQIERVKEMITWLKITEASENNLKSKFVQEYLTEACKKLISKVKIHSLNELVNYLFDGNPKEYITNFMSNYGVESCISLVSFTEISDLEAIVDEDLISDRFLLYTDFVDTWVDESNLKDTLKGKLVEYGNPSSHSNDMNITDNMFETNAEKLRRWKVIDDNYSKFMGLFSD